MKKMKKKKKSKAVACKIYDHQDIGRSNQETIEIVS